MSYDQLMKVVVIMAHFLFQMSATSDAGSMGEGFGLSMVSTTPDEQSQVFMVLGEDVSKSVVSSCHVIHHVIYLLL